MALSATRRIQSTTTDKKAPSLMHVKSTTTSQQELPESDTVALLRTALITERISLATRFRALFSLKHYASQHPETSSTLSAISAIAAAFSSPSALLKHELAYCLGQTRNLSAAPFLRHILENKEEDIMCRHEAAEALGALGDWDSLEMLKMKRDDSGEAKVVRETCEIAVGRVEWEYGPGRKWEHLRDR